MKCSFACFTPSSTFNYSFSPLFRNFPIFIFKNFLKLLPLKLNFPISHLLISFPIHFTRIAYPIALLSLVLFVLFSFFFKCGMGVLYLHILDFSLYFQFG